MSSAAANQTSGVDLGKAPSAKCATEETRQKAAAVYQTIEAARLAPLIKEMDKFAKASYITKRYGNKSEAFGVDFGLFPLWEAIVEELITAEEREIQGIRDAVARIKSREAIVRALGAN